ncbi:hypothetical protein [uncultured Ruminococcus sp.]|uniref:hypothetical protein n=1 Tax=uncultured Ruminococcus sp. TaxID=165186 RepID=UPI00344F2F3B
MKKKIMSIIAAAAMICGVNTALPVNAESPAIVETATKSFSYKGMTFDEAIKDISGNYIWLSGSKEKLTPDWKYNRNLLTLDENSKIHIIEATYVATAIKMEAGKVLPYDDIKAAVEAERLIMPIFRKNGSEYEIISAESREAYDYTLELIKACPEVTAINMHYKLYEDTANYVSMGGVYYSGDMTADEFTEKYPDFTAEKSDVEGKLYFSYNSNGNNFYETMKNIQDNGDKLEFIGAMTELASLNHEVYYCNEPVIIDGTMGDANIDGYVDLSDSVMIMQSLANPDKYGITADGGITAQGKVNGDTDGNGLTNNDAREIQMSLLGLGSLPIPQKDDDITLVNYDYVDFTEEDNNFILNFNDKEYYNSGATVGLDAIGNEIGEYEVLDREKNSGGTADVLAMADVSSEFAVAVKYNGSNNYHVYRNMWYQPKTVGQLIDDYNLEKYLNIYNVVYNGYRPEHISEKYLADKEYIWNTLFGNRDLETSGANDDAFYSISQIDRKDRYCELEVICSLPVFGRNSFALKVHMNGVVWTNMVECGTHFYIGEEKALELIEKYSPKS